jgi:hypothetical protein
MADEPTKDSSQPDQPTPEPPSTQPPSAAAAAPPPAAPTARSGGFGRFVRHRATQLVATGVAGLLIGAGVVALVDDDGPGRRPAIGYIEWDGPHHHHVGPKGGHPDWDRDGDRRLDREGR